MSSRYAIYQEMIKAQFTYQNFLEYIDAQIPFSFARYGDGEWNAILGPKKPHKNTNCDGHQYFPEMGQELGEIIKSEPQYILGIQSLAMRLRGEEIEQFVKDLNISWCDADILHKASIKGNLDKLFAILNQTPEKIVIVGPEYLRAIRSKIKYGTFIAIPQKDCYLVTKQAINECAKIMTSNRGMIFLFSASMATNVWIDQLYIHFGQDNTLLDCGSVFDPYIGVNKRSYHKDIISRESQQAKTL